MELILGDCAEVLKTFDDNSVDAIVTDPPAGIGFMGKEWDRDKGGRDKWIEWMAGIASECLRVLKPGGHALVWALPRTSHWTATAWEDAGFETRERIVHCFGSGFPKSLSIGKKVDEILGNEREDIGAGNDKGRTQTFGGSKSVSTRLTKGNSEWEGWGTALKPAIEDWWLFRKPLSEKSIAENVLKHGTGGLNIDGGRIGTAEETRREKSGWQDKGYVGGKYDNEKHNAFESRGSQGRFPANLIHDGSDEVMSCFPETKSGSILPHHKRSKVYGRNSFNESITVSSSITSGDQGSASRFFYCAKPSKAERDGGLWGFELQTSGVGALRDSGRGKTAHNFHPTVKAQKLMTYLCRLITPPGGTILDPFMGSGSTGKAAVAEGFDFIGIEKDPDYFEIAKARIECEKNRAKQMELF